MFEKIATFIDGFLHGSTDQIILIVLIILVVFFSLITFVLFLITVYLRIATLFKEIRTRRRSKNWDPVILDVMDASISASAGYKKLKWRNSISYLLYLELYIDIVRGKEKERLLALGKFSLKKLHQLLRSQRRKKRLYGIHLLALFHPEEQYNYMRFDTRDMQYTLTMIREMRTTDNFYVKERLINMLFLFKYISPVYISNILADMGEDIIPIMKILMLERKDRPYEQVIAVETIRRMHHTECLDLSANLLQSTPSSMVMISCLRYLEEQGNENYAKIVRPFLRHPNARVRATAVETYIELCQELSADDLSRIFSDPSVRVAVNAAGKLQLQSHIPYLEPEQIESFKWADIYKQMVY